MLPLRSDPGGGLMASFEDVQRTQVELETAERAFKDAMSRQAEAILKELEAISDPLPETTAAIEGFRRLHLSY
jgi:hypothetical protein